MGARLARFTGNATFADYSEDTWNWLTSVGFVDTDTWAAYDGAHVDTNCTDIAKAQWFYNAAVLTQGAAFMYNFASLTATNGSDIWRDRAEKLSDALLETFFPDGIAYEAACGGIETCPTEALFMKGYAHRWLSSATQVAPFLPDKLLPVLRASAEAADKQCVESDDGGTVSHRCGFYWRNGTFVDPAEADGTTGVGEGLSVFAAVSSLLIAEAAPPATAGAGGAGNSSDSSGTGQSGSSSGTSDGNLPSGTAASGTGARRIGLEAITPMVVGVVAALACVI
ncbi:hypothetical protein diail_2313 [Diaporthe ilicicola]|nr:hypothetical protein diail_2313 [Diaporthe ilicicola]